MIAVLFEVWPRDSAARETYLGIAAHLLRELESIDGFISVERFQSISDPTKFLSISFFRDEEAVKSWRTTTAHRAAQSAGRDSLFADYRLRIASVIRDYGMSARAEAPSDSRARHG